MQRGTEHELIEFTFLILNVPTHQNFEIELNEWHINAKALKYSAEVNVFNEIKIGNSNATHLGTLCRKDRGKFWSQDVEDLRASFHFGLSFCTGLWSPSILRCGFNDQGELVWECWQNTFTHAGYAETWWSTVHIEPLQQVVSKFTDVRNNPVWRNEIAIPVHLYVECLSGTGPIEGHIIWLQSALELLAWVYFVDVQRIADTNAFRSKSAAERIKLLLNEASIPVAIPVEATELSNFASTLGGHQRDGPGVLTYIRNGVGHPNHRARAFGTPPRRLYQAKSLGLQYLELVLLWLLDYQGSWSNRLIPGRNVLVVESVPWASSSP